MTMREVLTKRILKRRSPRRPSGLAIGEVLVLTLPLCLLCIAAASKLAATASARIKGQWQVAQQVQLATTAPCGDSSQLSAPVYGVTADGQVDQAWPVLAVSLLPAGGFGSGGLTGVSSQSSSLSTAAPNYFYKGYAESALPDGINQVQTRATFVCNEPGDPGDGARGRYYEELQVLGLAEAASLFGIGPGVPNISPPSGGDSQDETGSGTTP
jgi:hypothetical protein